MTRRTLAFAGAWAAVAGAQVPTFSTRRMRDLLVGPWILLSFERVASGAAPEYPLGADAMGRLVYDPFGRMSFQAMRRNRPLFASDQWHGTPEEIRAAIEGYVAYLGSYEVNEGDKYIVHHVEMSLYPNWVGTGLKYFYDFQGRRLVLEGRSETGLPETRLTWQRE